MRRRELIALILLAACKKTEPAASSGSAKGSAIGAIAAVAPLASKDYFRVDAGPRTPCTVGARCEARLVLTALGDYHVNEKYPFKLVADASPGVTIDDTGAFALDDAKTGTLTVRYTAAKPGTAKVSGTFKLSVCTDENCQIESPKVTFDVIAN
jgi:hypothetical protein